MNKNDWIRGVTTLVVAVASLASANLWAVLLAGVIIGITLWDTTNGGRGQLTD